MIVPLFLHPQKRGFFGLFGFWAKNPKISILANLAKTPISADFCKLRISLLRDRGPSLVGRIKIRQRRPVIARFGER
jgi:hypothetical protein